jgi:hypothetical protein
MNRRIALIAGLMLFAFAAKAQVYNYADGEGPVDPDSISGLYFGLNLGVYFANSNTASIYGGYGYNRDGTLITNFSNSWLQRAIDGGDFQRDRTNIALGGTTDDEWTFAESDMPGVMRYSGSFMYGLHIRYMVDADFGIYAEINGTNPVTVGEFTIQRTAPSPDPTQNQRLERFGIRGEEQRLMVNLGVHKVLLRKSFEEQGKSTTILPYFDLGACVTFARFEENIINLDQAGTVNLLREFNSQGQFIQDANILTGAGLGGFVGLGGQITLGSKFTINIGYIANLQQVTLGEFGDIGMQHQIVLKAIYM